MSRGKGNGLRTKDDLAAMCDIDERKDGCWLWTGSTTDRNRPSARVNGIQSAGPRLMALALGIDGDRPKDKRWSVRCGEAACIAPHHLVLVTQAEVMVLAAKTGRLKRKPDAIARIRASRAGLPTTKPDWMVRKAIESDAPAHVLAAEFGVSATAVKQWRAGKWRASVVAGPFAQLLGRSA